jgi:hypothetical protein
MAQTSCVNGPLVLAAGFKPVEGTIGTLSTLSGSPSWGGVLNLFAPVAVVTTTWPHSNPPAAGVITGIGANMFGGPILTPSTTTSLFTVGGFTTVAANTTINPSDFPGGQPAVPAVRQGILALAYGGPSFFPYTLAMSINGPLWYLRVGNAFLNGWIIQARQGALTPVVTNFLVGRGGFVSQGAVSRSLFIAGIPITSSEGVLSSNVTTSFSGSLSNLFYGSLSPDQSSRVTGISATSTGGSLAPFVGTIIQLTGLSATFSGGLLTAGYVRAITGIASTSAKGSVVSALSANLPGTAIAVAKGIPVTSVTHNLAGRQATLSKGAISSAIRNALTGTTFISTEGIMSVHADVTRRLSGISAAIKGGKPSTVIGKSIFGQSFAMSKGSITPALAGHLSGSSMTISKGAISSISVIRSLGGLSAVTKKGVIAYVNKDVTIALSGKSASASLGSLYVGGNPNRDLVKIVLIS